MNVRGTYKYYKEESKNPVPLNTYVKIINAYICFIMNHIFDGEEVKLPCRFGSIRIKGRKQKMSIDEDGNIKGLTPNWGKTKKLWESDPEAKEQKKIIYNTNENTNGIIYKFHWDKNDCRLKHAVLFSFVATRFNKRHLNKLIVQDKKEY